MFLLLAPSQIIVLTYFIYREIGPATFAGIGFLLAFVPVQILLSRLYGRYRHKMSQITDSRVKIMTEILAGARVLKMLACTSLFDYFFFYITKWFFLPAGTHGRHRLRRWSTSCAWKSWP
jgi:ATP-binding cassette subfamily C (CFTR/MRP) protein 4